MEIDEWVGSYKVRSFPWIDGKLIYFNVQYYKPGQSLEKSSARDKTVYITDDDNGRWLVCNLTHSLAEHVSHMQIASKTKVVLTVEPQSFNNFKRSFM